MNKTYFLTFLICLTCVAQNKTASNPTLSETIIWMSDFSEAHGYMGTGSFRRNSLSGVKGCAVSVNVTFPKATDAATNVKKTLVSFNLADLDPKSVKVINNSDDDTHQVNFERTDAQYKIEMDMEYGDGHKEKLFTTDSDLFFDSKESAARFAKGLTHAITMCGGTAAPF